jgi:hypothetical protein
MSPIGKRNPFASESLRHNPEKEIQKQKEGRHWFDEVSKPVPSPWSQRQAQQTETQSHVTASRTVSWEQKKDLLITLSLLIWP